MLTYIKNRWFHSGRGDVPTPNAPPVCSDPTKPLHLPTLTHSNGCICIHNNSTMNVQNCTLANHMCSNISCRGCAATFGLHLCHGVLHNDHTRELGNHHHDKKE